MSTNTIDSISKPDRKWNDLQDMIAELVVEDHGYPPVKTRHAATASDDVQHSPSPTTVPAQDDPEPNQLERDIAEIERAVEALRKGEPDLEPWTNSTIPAPEPRKFRSVWFFVGTIWIATVLVTGAATLAITSLL
jgi:hypothetical protein